VSVLCAMCVVCDNFITLSTMSATQTIAGTDNELQRAGWTCLRVMNYDVMACGLRSSELIARMAKRNRPKYSMKLHHTYGKDMID